LQSTIVVKSKGKNGKWLISKQSVINYFKIGVQHEHNQEHGHKFHTDIIDHVSDKSNEQHEQVIELLKKQVEDLKAQLDRKDQQTDQQMRQKDQQIEQLHILLKEAQASKKQLEHKPNEKLGVFSRALVKFGL